MKKTSLVDGIFNTIWW